jgi:putative ABC transport system permease protein
LETIRRDVRYAIRTLTNHPGFTIFVVLTLALGIGANSGVFSLIYGILLRPFPYREPGRLVRIQTVLTKTTGSTQGASVTDVEDWRAQSQTLEGVGLYLVGETILSGDGAAQPVQSASISAQALSLLGVSPVVGRLFTPEEDQPGGDVKKAVLSYGLWQSAYGADREIVGRAIKLRGDSYTVVGVMPPGFHFPEKSDLWVPIHSRYASFRSDWWKARDVRGHTVIARLKSGVTLEQAQTEMNAVAARLQQEFPTTNAGVEVRLSRLRDAEVGNVRPYLLLLLGAVALVLLICCVNVANLMLARAGAREREIAVRAALGAGRWRIIRQLLTESLLLSLLGGLIGLALAWLGVKALLALIPVALPFWMKIAVDGPVFLFSLISAALTSILFGLIPAWQMSRTDLAEVLKDGTKASSAYRHAWRNGLIVTEFALSLMLLIGAGLMMQSFVRLLSVDAGIKRDGLLTAQLFRFVPNATFDEMARAYSDAFFRVKERLARIPGVIAVGGSHDLPYLNQPEERKKDMIAIRGQDEREQRQKAPVIGISAMPGYFDVMGTKLLAGRDFTEADDLKSPCVIIVNQHAADTLWPGREPLGQEARWGNDLPVNPWCKVIGVAADTKWQATESEKGIELYFSYRQSPPPRMHVLMRTSVAPETLVSAVRAAVREINPDIAVAQVKSMNRIVNEALWQRRLWGVLLATFAVIALLLAAVGIYGVMSQLVSQRTREIGIRMAMGAGSSDVLRMVVGQGMKLAVAGTLIGVGLAVAIARFVSSLLFGVTARDPLTFATTSLILLSVALLACYLPARRAAKVDPTIALRHE